MKLKDLYEAIGHLNRKHCYYLNDLSQISTNILEYNKKKKFWEYYLLDERGGKSDFKTFTTEEEACEYILKEAIENIKIMRDAYMDAVKRKYLRKD